MTQDNRDDFPAPVKRELAKRAAYRCSNPRCRTGTVGPHADPTKSVTTGAAAHIHGAAKGGPRYNESQSTEARKSIENGIWLCRTCADKIDKDEQTYSAEVIREWKRNHEAEVSGGDIVPQFPRISLTTQRGLFVPPVGAATVDSDLTNALRDHLVEIRSGSRHEIEQLILEIQFPESLIGQHRLESPVGVVVGVRENRPQSVAPRNRERTNGARWHRSSDESIHDRN
jgi:hypothetical protein